MDDGSSTAGTFGDTKAAQATRRLAAAAEGSDD